MHDVVIIGGGPAGLSAAINGAAEGLDVLLLERSSVLGGQAGTSSHIENFLGHSNGISGAQLIGKAIKQAKRFGVSIRTDAEVERLEFNPATGVWLVMIAGNGGGGLYVSRTVILATGVDYRRLEIPGGDTALYGAPASSHEECLDKDVVVIGGGNSAGQAVLNLARIGARVHLLVRRPLAETMSQYLIERIAVHPNVLATIGEPRAIEGPWVIYSKYEDADELPAHRVFAYIGMIPRTEFVHHCCSIKEPGFIHADENFAANQDGLFVAGDVRAGSFKRVAAAVGEGAIAAASVWRKVYGIK
jgi:thioredoxin reductase (NADPH)